MANNPTVTDNPAESRYEIRVDGELAGFAHYRSTSEAVVFDHTEVDDDREGEGLGGRLARGALNDVRAKGRRVIAECPFIKDWIAKHDDYADLVA